MPRALLGSRLQQIRVSRKLSQGELARRSGCSQREIAAYERGKTLPKMERLVKLAEELEVDLSAFFTYTHPEDPDLDRLIVFVRRISKEKSGFAARALRILRAVVED